MKKRELVPGTKYAINKGRRSSRAGIQDAYEVLYFGDDYPQLPKKPGHVLVCRNAWKSETSVTLEYVKPQEILSTWEAYRALCDAYDEREARRVEYNQKSMAYLKEQMVLIYTEREAAFIEERGYFRVSVDTMAKLHGLPTPNVMVETDDGQTIKEMAQSA